HGHPLCVRDGHRLRHLPEHVHALRRLHRPARPVQPLPQAHLAAVLRPSPFLRRINLGLRLPPPPRAASGATGRLHTTHTPPPPLYPMTGITSDSPRPAPPCTAPPL
uniref:Uncharacterized protein n=1 Tax=Zea mays TaxID=4577 RepID=A0A804NE43_MAIZE